MKDTNLLNRDGEEKNNFYYIPFKYTIGDVVLLLNGKIRKIQSVNISAYEDYMTIGYQGKWYTPIFSEQDVVCLLSSDKNPYELTK